MVRGAAGVWRRSSRVFSPIRPGQNPGQAEGRRDGGGAGGEGQGGQSRIVSPKSQRKDPRQGEKMRGGEAREVFPFPRRGIGEDPSPGKSMR